MPGPGARPDDGRSLLDFSLSEREFLDLPLTSRTLDPVTDDITQEVRSATGPDGITYTVTVDWTYDVDGFVEEAVVTYDGGGRQRTETWTYTVNATGEVTAEAVVRN